MERGGRGCPTALVRSGNGTLPVSHRSPDRSLVAEQANAIRTNPGTSASKEFGRQHSNCRIAAILACAKGSRTGTPLANFRDSLACIAHKSLEKAMQAQSSATVRLGRSVWQSGEIARRQYGGDCPFEVGHSQLLRSRGLRSIKPGVQRDPAAAGPLPKKRSTRRAREIGRSLSR
jgi:hypothetical protein